MGVGGDDTHVPGEGDTWHGEDGTGCAGGGEAPDRAGPGRAAAGRGGRKVPGEAPRRGGSRGRRKAPAAESPGLRHPRMTLPRVRLAPLPAWGILGFLT